jgi:AcrR family transcriptional regulator
LERLHTIRRPAPEMGQARVGELTRRQREILDELGEIFDGGFAELSMAALAKRLNCSLRTLYALAPSRDELVLAVVDRRLRRMFISSLDAVTDDMSPVEALTAYLHAGNRALGKTSPAFSRDMRAVPTVGGLIQAHNDYVFRLSRALLELAIEAGDIRPVDTAAVAIVFAGLGWQFTRLEVQDRLQSSFGDAIDVVVDVIIDGICANPPVRDARDRT